MPPPTVCFGISQSKPYNLQSRELHHSFPPALLTPWPSPLHCSWCPPHAFHTLPLRCFLMCPCIAWALPWPCFCLAVFLACLSFALLHLFLASYTSHCTSSAWQPLSDCLLAMQTKYGKPLAIPLFIALAQSRNQSIVGVDRGVGSFGRKAAESRIRIVSGRYDHANKLMVQVSTPSSILTSPSTLACMPSANL